MEEKLSEERINELIEQGETLIGEMDESYLITCLKTLREKLKINSNLRLKYSGVIDKYVESEIDLHEEIKVLQRIAVYPNLIGTFIQNGGIETVTELLSHENVDIVNDAVILTEEITDADYLQELQNPKEYLELFISASLFELLVSNLLRINEADEEQTVTDILSVIENFIEIYPFSIKLLADKTKLIQWLLNRIKSDEITNESNKLFASEILYTMTQFSSDIQYLLAKKEAIPHLLMIIIKKQTNKISDTTEEEFILNIVNIICSCLLIKENQIIFRNSDGIKIVLSLLKENNIFRHLGIKILNFALLNNSTNSKEFVQSEGLSALFSFFMGKGLSVKKKYDSICGEEHCINIITSLSKYLRGVERDRFIYKFRENHFEKCERLIEFYKKYDKIKEFRKHNDEIDDEDNESIASTIFNFQNITVILAFLICNTNYKSQLEKLLSINNISIETIRLNLKLNSSHFGDETPENLQVDEITTNKNFIENLIKNL